ncbi:MAG: LysR substrate-binding domain-containing protein [Acetobacteraceae bacterium]
MDIRQLKYFVCIVEQRSFTKAAETLRITQPALGLQIRKLEEELQTPLLVRHSRGVVPTPEGRLLVERARSILADIDAAVHAVRDLGRKAKSRVRVGLAPTVSTMLAMPIARCAGETLETVHLDLAEAASPILLEWVASGHVDLAIACEGDDSLFVRRDPLLSESLFLVRPALPRFGNGARTVRFEELADEHLFIADPMLTRALLRKLQETADAVGIHLHVASVLPSVENAKALVEEGRGATVLPYFAVRRECEQGRLVAQRIVDPMLVRRAFLLRPARRSLTHAELAMVDVIRRVVQTEICIAPEYAVLDDNLACGAAMRAPGFPAAEAALAGP